MTPDNDQEHHLHDFGPRHFEVVTPGLLVDDVPAASEYYRDVLGFSIRFTWGNPPTFAAVHRGQIEIHFVQSDPPGRRNGIPSAGPGNGADFYIGVTDVDELHEELKKRGAKVLREPKTMPHGMREFTIDDLNGYRIILGEAVQDPT